MIEKKAKIIATLRPAIYSEKTEKKLISIYNLNLVKNSIQHIT
jgi:hypothetical protein